MQIYVLHDKEPLGPYDEAAIAEAIKSGVFSKEQLARTDGQDEWRSLDQLLSLPQSVPRLLSTGGELALLPVESETLEVLHPINVRSPRNANCAASRSKHYVLC